MGIDVKSLMEFYRKKVEEIVAGLKYADNINKIVRSSLEKLTGSIDDYLGTIHLRSNEQAVYDVYRRKVIEEPAFLCSVPDMERGFEVLEGKREGIIKKGEEIVAKTRYERSLTLRYDLRSPEDYIRGVFRSFKQEVGDDIIKELAKEVEEDYSILKHIFEKERLSEEDQGIKLNVILDPLKKYLNSEKFKEFTEVDDWRYYFDIGLWNLFAKKHGHEPFTYARTRVC